MNHIIVIGFMASGKTRVGKRLSRDLKLPFTDLDKMITERLKMSVNEIFKRFGEPFYRAMETWYIRELIEESPNQRVISLSAAFPIQKQNESLMRELGTVIYLKASAETILERLKDMPENPLSKDEEAKEKVVHSLELRDPVYESFADIQVVTGVKSFDALVREIESKLKAREKAPKERPQKNS